MKKNQRLFLPISLIIHLVFLSIFFINPQQQDHIKPPKEPIAFEIIKGPISSHPSAPTTGPKAAEKKLLRFNNNFSPGLPRHGELYKNESQNFNLSSGWSEEDWGYGGGVLTQVENYINLRDIAEEVDGLLFYPPALAQREYTGGVRAKLFFKKKGGCDWKRTKIESETKYFRVYILALLKKLCSLERMSHLQLPRGDRIDLAFNFFTKDAQDLKHRPEYKVVGNVLLFERHAFKPPLELRLGPIRWYGPYIAVDFQWIFEKWDEQMNGKDPLADFR